MTDAPFYAPTPWQSIGCDVKAANGEILAYVYPGTVGEFRLSSHSVARLMASAPDLREAAWLALEELTQWQGMDEDDEGTAAAIAALRAALDKGAPDDE